MATTIDLNRGTMEKEKFSKNGDSPRTQQHMVLVGGYDSSSGTMKYLPMKDGALQVTAKINTGDIDVNTLSIDSSALIGKSANGDFTTAYTSATTITITDLPAYHPSLSNEDIASIVQIDNTGAVVNTYSRDDAVMTVATNVITVTGATFAATDTFVIYTNVKANVNSADTSRTTDTQVTTVQHVDETGEVLASMNSNTNAGFQQITDGTNEVDVIATINSLKSDVSSVAGTATNVNGGNRDTGTQTVTLADDDPATVSLALIDDAIGTHDSAVVSKTIQTGLDARSSQATAVATGDNVRAISNLYGEQVIAGYDWSSKTIGVKEKNSLDTKYSNIPLVDTTNITATTHYYPSATGATMDGYKDLSLSGKFIDADGTLTLTLEGTNDEDTTSGDWVQIYAYDDNLNAVSNSWTVTNGTLTFAISANNMNFRYYRWKVVASGATNTVILKERKKAL